MDGTLDGPFAANIESSLVGCALGVDLFPLDAPRSPF
jgi:hypothetical protein